MSPLRLMLLPYIKYFCGRCYCHMYWQMLLPIFLWKMLNHIFIWTICNKWVGWCYCLWQMEWPLQGDISLWQVLLPRVLSYFNLSSEVLNRTSSQMWGRWNFPIFLLRDGLLTLMYSASLIALLMFWSSLPTMLKFSMVTWWPVMLLWS